MKCVLKVLNCGHNMTGQCQVISIENNSGSCMSLCMINAGDSVTKYCKDHRVKLQMLSSLFVSSLAPHNTAGIAGLILTMSELGSEKLNIVGPHGLSGLLESIKPFTNRRYHAQQ
jgi:hypothetical protein